MLSPDIAPVANKPRYQKHVMDAVLEAHYIESQTRQLRLAMASLYRFSKFPGSLLVASKVVFEHI